MAKPSKSQNNDFLLERRKAIADLANRRRRQKLFREAGINLQSGNNNKVVTPLSLSSPPPPARS